MEKKPAPALWICILLDLIGYASFTIPGIGEFGDIIWAPLAGIIYFRLFGGKMGKLGGIFAFLEEVFPFSDIIPSFTIGWLIRNSQSVKAERRAMRIQRTSK